MEKVKIIKITSNESEVKYLKVTLIHNLSSLMTNPEREMGRKAKNLEAT